MGGACDTDDPFHIVSTSFVYLLITEKYKASIISFGAFCFQRLTHFLSFENLLLIQIQYCLPFDSMFVRCCQGTASFSFGGGG